MLKLTVSKLWARSYASWQALGSTEIRVSSLVVEGISTQDMKRFDAIPRSGRRAEVGGILLGKSGENEIVVDDFEPVLCEHRFGPSFRLSDSDRIAWRETVQRIRQREEFAIVGWYRTDTRDEFALSEDDRELLDTELHQDCDVILLIKPTQSQPYEAKLFIRDDGHLREVPQATYFASDRGASSLVRPSPAEPPVKGEPTARTETPFSGNEQQLRNPTGEPKESVPIPSDAPESRSEFEPIVPLARSWFLVQQPPEERKSRKLSFIIGAMVLAAMCGTLGYYSVRTRPAAPASRRSAEQAPAPPSTSQMAPAPQPAQASAVQPADTKATVQPPNATEDQPLAADTDRQVLLFLLKWADAEKSANIDDLGDFYAPKISRYFSKRGVTRANVRAARAHEYAKYGRMIVCDIKNISVNPIDSGQAVVTFRRRWQTAGPRVLMGEQQEQLTLVRDQGRWQIGAEERTKLYWIRQEHHDPASRRPARAAR